MRNSLSTLFAVAVCAVFAGCGHLDVTPAGPTDRVVTGVVTDNSRSTLPAEAELTVRVVDVSQGENKAEQLGEQTVLNPGTMPVPFRVEFQADDALLRRGVNLEARVSVGGHLWYTTPLAHSVTLASVKDPQVIEVEPTRKH